MTVGLTALFWELKHHVRQTRVLSHVRRFANPGTVACQALLFIQFSRQEYRSGLPFPPPGDLLNPGKGGTSCSLHECQCFSRRGSSSTSRRKTQDQTSVKDSKVHQTASMSAQPELTISLNSLNHEQSPKTTHKVYSLIRQTSCCIFVMLCICFLCIFVFVWLWWG